MTKYAIGAFLVFLASLIWLALAWSNGNRTKNWTPIPATVLSNDVQRGGPGLRRNRPSSIRGWLTRIRYTVDGVEYEGAVDEYLIGQQVTVYVNPNDPTQVVGKTGPRIQDMGRPIILAVASGLFAIVLVIIALSPQDD